MCYNKTVNKFTKQNAEEKNDGAFKRGNLGRVGKRADCDLSAERGGGALFFVGTKKGHLFYPKRNIRSTDAGAAQGGYLVVILSGSAAKRDSLSVRLPGGAAVVWQTSEGNGAADSQDKNKARILIMIAESRLLFSYFEEGEAALRRDEHN